MTEPEPEPTPTSALGSVKAVAVSLLSSKKVLSAAAGILTIIAVKIGLPEETAGPLSLQITGIVATLIAGQGAADFGKAAKAAK